MRFLRILLGFFQRITNDRQDRFPLTKETKIASLRRDVRRNAAKAKMKYF